MIVLSRSKNAAGRPVRRGVGSCVLTPSSVPGRPRRRTTSVAPVTPPSAVATRRTPHRRVFLSYVCRPLFRYYSSDAPRRVFRETDLLRRAPSDPPSLVVIRVDPPRLG